MGYQQNPGATPIPKNEYQVSTDTRPIFVQASGMTSIVPIKSKEEANRKRYDFGGGTFFPSLRASESPMAMACLGFVTFFPLRPLLSVPCFIAFISLSTSFCAAGEYLRVDFLAEDFFAVDVAM
jgi:hypothetical protein